MNRTQDVESRRLARLVLAALIFVFGLQSMRFFFASLTWYLRDTVGVGVLDLVPIAVAPFLLAAIVPVTSRWLGARRSVWVAVAVLISARILLQVDSNPATDLWASAVGIFAFVGLLPLLLGMGRDAMVGGLLLGLAIDSAIKGLGLSLDLAYQPGFVAVLAVLALSGGIIWALINTPPENARGVSLGRGVLLLSLGPFLFAQLLILQPQGWTSAVTGMSGPATQLRVGVLNAIALYLAYRWQGKRWPVAVGVLVVVLVVLAAEGNGATFNVLALLAIPLAGVAWSGLVPDIDRSGVGASAFYLTAAMTIFLGLGLAYYLPLDLNLGFGQADVRHLVGLLILIVGIGGLSRLPAGSAVGPQDWLFAAAAGALTLVSFGVALPTDSSADSATSDPLRFMTYNLHSAFNTDGVLDVEAIARVVENWDADVVAFQEMPRGRLISGTTDLLTLLKLRLGFEHVAYFGTTDPVWGNAVFSHFPISNVGADYLPRVGTPMQRGYLGATITVGERDILVISTHLQHVNDQDRHDDDPEADLLPVHTEQIAQILDSWGGQTPAVLMGDFNARPDWDQISQLRAAGWIDSWDEAGIGEGLTSSAADPTYRIDYIFHTPDMEALTANVVQSPASDHFAVVADLTSGR